jgi:intracellular multiplication protein IcmC
MRSQIIQRNIVIGVGVLITLFPELAYAASAVDAIQMLINLSRTYPALWFMLTGAGYVIGFAFAMRGVYYLKQYGEMRTMMASNTSLKTPIIFFIVSGILIYMPSGFRVISRTVFGYSSPLVYSDVTAGMNPVVLGAITGLVSIIGLIAFIRGWLIMAKNAEHHGGPEGLGKALTHIVGGLLAMNILGVADIIWNTFGLKS